MPVSKKRRAGGGGKKTRSKKSKSGERVGFRKRLNAWLLEGLVIGFGGFGLSVLSVFVSAQSSSSGGATVGGVLGGILGVLLWMVGMSCVFLVWETCTGASLGKLALGIKIMSADGSPASVGQLLLRSLVKCNYSVLSLVVWVTGVQMLRTIGSFGCLVMLFGCLLALGGKKTGPA
ncbi:MAG: RDD family protein [Fuerstiella sp.]|nr:RDD family protein [Fuerstiella sp.]